MPIEMNLQKGLVGHWTMNSIDVDGGVVRDRSGYENHGVVSNAVGNYPSKSGDAFEFDGSSADIDCGNPDVLSAESIENKITLSVWLNPSNSSGNRQDTLGKGDPAANDNYRLWVENGDVLFYVDEGSTGVRPSANIENEWTHVAGTWDGSTVRLYINGVEQVSVSLSGSSIAASEANFVIGSRASEEEFYEGLIDDGRIYTRTLSESEIKQLYNTRSDHSYGSPYVPQKPVAASNLVAWYPFEGEASDATAYQPWAADDTDYSGTVNSQTYKQDGGVSDINSGSGSSAYSFDSSGDPIIIPNDIPFSNDSFTLSSWINVSDSTADNLYSVSMRNDGYAEHGIRETGYFKFGGNSTAIEVGTVSSNTWHHLCHTSDAIAYIDGKQVGTSETDSIINGNSNNIGGRNGTEYVDGNIDDVRVYNRALSQSEIEQIYNNTKP